MGEGAAEREAAPVSMADTAAAACWRRRGARAAGPRLGFGPAGARSFFLKTFREK